MPPQVRFTLLGSALAVVGMAGTATAGEFFETDGAALQGHDAVAYFVENKPVKGSTEFTATHKGSVFRFASAKNRDAFSQDPDQYAPQFNGFCAWGVTRGYKAATQAESFSIVAGKLYLNYNAEVMAIWSTDKTALIQKGEAEWPRVEKTTKVAR